MGSGSLGDAAPSLRERKKLRTRDELEAAALGLFSERGFDAVTVDDIAAAADVSPRTFFRHFRSKEDVLFRDNEERLGRLRAELAKRPLDESPLTAVRLAILGLAEEYETGKEAMFLRTSVMAQTPSLIGRNLHLQQEWEAAIANAVAVRIGVDVDGDLRPRLVAACALGALRVAADAWLAGKGRGHLPTLVDAALQLVAGGGDASRWASGAGLSL